MGVLFTSKMKFLNAPKTPENIRKVLMVCKHNRFRSKVAEALFKKYNKSGEIKVESAATEPDYLPVSACVRKVLGKFGIKRINPCPRKLTKSMVKRADLIVIVADNTSVQVKDKKLIRWSISDTSQDNYKEILKRTRLIEKRIKKLISSLK